MTLREWQEHKAEMEERGVCERCPARHECDSLATDREAADFVGSAVRALYFGALIDALSVRIVAFEAGELNEAETVELFQTLVDTGLAWQLQGSYGRAAQAFIEAGVVKAPPSRRVAEA